MGAGKGHLTTDSKLIETLIHIIKYKKMLYISNEYIPQAKVEAGLK